jgi:maleylpyruvate isomerase
MIQLYTYFRSSASFRVRIALNLKGLAYASLPVHLLKDGGQQYLPEYRALNPDALVPTLVDDGHVLNQSLAIVEYLEETHPAPALLPGDALNRAYIRTLALGIACEIHPLNNLRVLKYLKHDLGVGEEAKNAWYLHWIEQGFAVLEQRLATDGKAGKFCVGDTATLADICLVPQVFNAMRFNLDLAKFPTIKRVFDHCMTVEAFDKAKPSSQPDAE